MKPHILIATIALCSAACSNDAPPLTEKAAAEPLTETTNLDMDSSVKQYLLLELSMGLHDPGHVDAYFGPTVYQQQAEKEALSLDDISNRATALALSLAAVPDSDMDSMEQLRNKNLGLRLTALLTRIELLGGNSLGFDDESMLLFNATAPTHNVEHFEAIIQQIDKLLPGNQPLPERVKAFRDRFIIPPERLSAVFEAALNECRRRTLQHIELPEHESFSVEYVTDKPWSGYNWYQGNANSLIQVNTDLPSYIDSAVNLGCHEGYPGHHTYNTLLEQNLVVEKGWQEFSLYPLFSPQSLIAEGSANFGIELAFPGNERMEFERAHLFPLAGLEVADADTYYQLLKLRNQLNYAGNEAARNYLDGKITSKEAQHWLVNYALETPERAAKRISFFDTYRSYVINYNYGKDLVADWVTADNAGADERWQRFIQLLSLPMAPSELQKTPE